MRNFNARFRLRDTDRHIRLVYTWFLLLMLAGFIFTFFWAHSMTELSLKGLAEHYRGSDATFGEPMPFGQLAETTHFHLFTMPVTFMILVHVLYLTMVSPTHKSGYDMDGLCRGHPGSGFTLADCLCIPNLYHRHVDRRHPDGYRISHHVRHTHV